MDRNLKVYNSKQVVTWYEKLKELLPVEKQVFKDFKIQEARLLDIGIGGGRTTSYLLPRCKEYTGIDYSESFIKAVKKEFPDAICLVIDARDLSHFETETFDFVNFSFNGIDYTDAEGRKKIISEINRILKPGGIFFFSTHNKAHSGFKISPWLNTSNSFIINLKNFIKFLPYQFKKSKHKKKEILAKDYAIINDSAHNYSLMTFYTSPAYLRQQLSEGNFTETLFYTRSGEKKEDHLLEDWIFVTAKKISA